MVEVLLSDPLEVVIRVSGSPDEAGGTPLAAQLARCLSRLGTTGRLVVDFAHSDALCDADLGAVARQLAGRADVRVRGLCRHHLRLLRYCGVHVAAGQPRGGGERES